MNRLVRSVLMAGLLVVSVIQANTIQADVPRLANGQPDLNGVWQALSRANDGLLPHPPRAARVMQEGPSGPVPAESVIVLGAVGAVPAGSGVVEGGSIPWLPGKEQIQQENAADWLNRDPEIKCYLPGVPRATYLPYPFQVFHSDQAIFIAYEFAGATRNLFLEDPGEAPVDSWMGQSSAQWEDDTLVVTVTGQHDKTWLDRTGVYHSAALVVTERYTLESAHVMQYSATIEDPETYSEPWTISMPLYKRVGSDATLQQFKCVEFVEELLYGQWRKEPLNPDRRSPIAED